MNDLTPAEREKLERLRDVAPPAGAESNVKRALRDRGLLGRATPRAGWLPQLAAGIAIATVLFLSGFYAGRQKGDHAMSGEAASTNGLTEYVLLVRESDPSAAPGVTEADRVREYGAWARDLASKGALENGWKLADDGRLIDPMNERHRVATMAVTTREGVGGLFIIRAANYDEAVQVAESCPHVKYGGIMEVRAIEK